MFLSWLPELRKHLDTLSADEDSPTRLTHVHLSYLITWLSTEYAETLETMNSLLKHSEITFDLIWMVFVPRKTILHIRCPTTSEPRAVRLVHAEKCQKAEVSAGSAAYDLSGLSVNFESMNQDDNSKYSYRLVVEYVETDVNPKGVYYGYAGLGTVFDIPGFVGTKKISSLGVYPIDYYEGPGGPAGLKERLVNRGRRWTTLAGGVNHLAYKGIAFIWRRSGPESFLVKQNVSSSSY